VLIDEIEAQELKKSAVAKELDILPGNLSEMFKGKCFISALPALNLKNALGGSANFGLSSRAITNFLNKVLERESS